MSEENRANNIRSECWKRAAEAAGTAWIFEQRAAVYGKWLNIFTYVGLAVPCAVGLLGITLGPQGLLPVVLYTAGALLALQAMLSLASLAFGWVTKQASANALMGQNNRLARRFEDLGRFPPEDLPQLEQEYQLLEQEAQQQEQLDNQQGITEQERRAGMRAGLRRYQQTCVGCGERPIDLTPTGCPVCGRFSVSSWWGIKSRETQ